MTPLYKLCRRNYQMLGAIILGIVFGSVASWWLNTPAPAWLNFTTLEAYYKSGAVEITTVGQYIVNRECAPSQIAKGDVPAGTELVIWRTEAIATDGQIASYGPRQPAPDFGLGPHRYVKAIPLTKEINPDGWVVRILITCPGESPETVTSPAAKVQVGTEGR